MWMDEFYMPPTYEEVEELMNFVTEHPLEFNYDVFEIARKCKIVYKMDEHRINEILLINALAYDDEL